VSNWIYRLRLGWNRLLHLLSERRSRGTFLFKPFFERYAPYFLAYSFPLARADEYEADAAAARLTSPRSVAAALATTEVMGAYIDKRFWPSIHQRVVDHPHPSFQPTRILDQHLAAGVAPEDEKEWLERALAQPSTVDDTHPALSERLAAIGEAPVVEHVVPGEGADQLLGAGLADIARRLDERWASDIAPSWEQHHEKLSRERSRLAELQAARRDGASLDAGQLLELASLTETHGDGEAAALPMFREAHSTHPDHAGACFALGARLLRADDDAGIALLERAMQLDRSAILPACEALRDYAWRRGRKEEAQEWHRRWSDAAKLADAVQDERSQITLSDKLDRHGLAPDVIERLRKQLAAVGVRKAWIARKRLKHDDGRPLYLLGIRSTPLWMWTREKRLRAVERAVYERVELPDETIVASLEGERSRFASKFRWKRARVL
jgi:hypothetical protein